MLTGRLFAQLPGIILVLAKGFTLPLLALLLTGIIALIVAILWKPHKKEEGTQFYPAFRKGNNSKMDLAGAK